MNKQNYDDEAMAFFDSLPDKARLLMYKNNKKNKGKKIWNKGM